MNNTDKKYIKLNNEGLTLVELMCTFAIIGLFMVAATNVIISAMSIHYNVKGTSDGIMVSSVITQKLDEAIEGAILGNNLSDVEGETVYMLIKKNEINGEIQSDSIELTDNTGSHVKIYVNDDGYLDIYYYAVVSESNIEGQAPVVEYKAVHWTFDDAAYMGYKIKSFNVNNSDASLKDNVLEIKFVLDHGKYGDFETTKYIECYNFNKAQDIDKIKVIN